MEHKEDIHLESIEQNGEVIFTIRLNEDDYGRLIGKKGKTINALRHLLNIYNIKKNRFSKKNCLERRQSAATLRSAQLKGFVFPVYSTSSAS